MKFPILLSGLMLTGIALSAQENPGKKQVNITSTFKPSLKEAAKINFNATPPVADTSRPNLQYTIPNQNLSFVFQPGSLKPLALQVDSGGKWSNESFLKIGYGNLNSPYALAGLSFGDGKNAGINAYVKHNASKGKLPLQQYSNSSIDLNAFLKSSKNLAWDARFGGYQEKYKKYGGRYRPGGEDEDSVNVQYQTWRARLGFHNINLTEFGLSYAPELKVDVFNGLLGNTESNTYLNLPLEKKIGKSFAIDLALTANMSRYKPGSKKAIANNYFLFSPSIILKKQAVLFQVGIRPSWDNNEFKLLPNILAEFNTNDKRFAVQFGWTANLRNSGYQYQAEMNPWIWAPATVYNTRIEERYVGIKGTLGDHFSYSAKASYNIVNNQPLFVNDTVTGRSFLIIRESEMKVGGIGGEIGYNIGEKFSVVSNLSWREFQLKDNVKSWGMLPLEWKTDLRLQIMKDLYLNSTLYAFDGPWSLSRSGRTNLPAAMDLSAGLEFKIVKNVKLWAQFNNILNKEYQRWNQYPVYGFNFLVGIVFSFAQKN